MNVYNFINEQEYQKIAEAVASQSELEYAVTYQKCRVNIDSSRASCDFADNITKENDYILLTNFCKGYGNYHGHGGPHSVNEFLEILESYDSFLQFLDNGISILDAKDYEPINNLSKITRKYEPPEQLCLF